MINRDILIPIIATSLLLFLLTTFIIAFLSIYQRKRRQYKIEKQLLQVQFTEELLHTQIEIQEQTLKTISQEIHDNVGQVLSLAKLHLNTFPATTDENIQLKVGDTKDLIGKAINDLRDLSRSMHGDKIADLGIREAIANELKILQNTQQYKTELKIIGEPFKLNNQEEIVIFRVLQEALNNGIKYSKAKNIDVSLLYEPRLFKFILTDDGIGFDTSILQSSHKGIGLKNMQNRTTLIGGIFSITSTINTGTTIQITLNK
ncbi:MAG TPA: ATP-binding protein [Ferruginibacter sp.]|jgi:two-component system NarL family sensor kinase|nr:ATP-binding protein [Ferruginibacter sp.]